MIEREMADTLDASAVAFPARTVGSTGDAQAARHSAIVRVTHWLHAAGFLGLIVSGVAILLAHPRLYWGETGAWGTPPLINLPLPLVLGHSGWGRYLHFLSAWACVLTGSLYIVSGLVTRHIGRDLIPRRGDLSPARVREILADHLNGRLFDADDGREYNLVQRLAYLAVVFLLFPFAIVTGLAMSPAIASVAPAIVRSFGGQQSARTLHFFVAAALVLFLFVHVAMVIRAGFVRRTAAMIFGRLER